MNEPDAPLAVRRSSAMLCLLLSSRWPSSASKLFNISSTAAVMMPLLENRMKSKICTEDRKKSERERDDNELFNKYTPPNLIWEIEL